MSEIPPLHLTDLEKKLPHHQLIGVKGGTFMMGGEDSEAFKSEKPLHKVRLDSFYMGKYPVTQALWLAVMRGKNPSRFIGDNRPVEQVSWDDAQAFIQKLNEQTGRNYRLPTEAEWEYAARGGIYSAGFLYAGSDKLKEVGWYEENSGGESHEVGFKLPNELGIHDLSGNVFEWCEDWYGGSAYYETCRKAGLVENPTGPKSGSSRVMRGGYWGDDARYCRVSCRNHYSPGDRDLQYWLPPCRVLPVRRLVGPVFPVSKLFAAAGPARRSEGRAAGAALQQKK